MIESLRARFEAMCPSQDLALRQLTQSDMPALCDIEQRVHKTPWSEANFRSSLENNLCVGIFHGDTLIAYCVLSLNRYEGEVLLIAVDTSFQKKGVARTLLRSVLDCCQSEETTEKDFSVFLEVRRSNTVAQGLYDSLGFNEVGVRSDYYQLPSGGKEDALIYAYQLLGD